MAIGDTSIIKDAKGVSITVKDIASDYLIEQEDGTYHRENHRTEASQIIVNSKTLNQVLSDKVFGLAISKNTTTALANFDAQFDKALPYGFVNNCDYAAQSGIAAKILKSGLYYIDAHIYITGTNDTNFSLTVTQNGTDLCVANDNPCWGAFHLNVQSIEKLNANDLIKVKANRQQGSTAAYVMQTAFTHLILYPIALD